MPGQLRPLHHDNAISESRPAYICSGDLVRAISALGLHDSLDIQRVASMLGLATHRSLDEGPTEPVDSIAEATSQGYGIPITAPERGVSQLPLAEHLEPPPQADRRVPALVVREDPPPLGAEFLVGIRSLDPPGQQEKPAEPLPLLLPRFARAMAFSALARSEPGGSPDVNRLVNAVATRRPVDRIPRRQRLSVRRGADVLVDRGRGMDPFAFDRRQLTQRLRSVAGDQRTRVLSFVGTPARGVGTGPRSRWHPYRPVPGVPVVVLTDLGLAWQAEDAASAAEWVAWWCDVSSGNRPVAAFVPYPRSRISSELLAAVPVLEWDVSTTPSSVRRALWGLR
jgi:hypothetical protein